MTFYAWTSMHLLIPQTEMFNVYKKKELYLEKILIIKSH